MAPMKSDTLYGRGDILLSFLFFPSMEVKKYALSMITQEYHIFLCLMHTFLSKFWGKNKDTHYT